MTNQVGQLIGFLHQLSDGSAGGSSAVSGLATEKLLHLLHEKLPFIHPQETWSSYIISSFYIMGVMHAGSDLTYSSRGKGDGSSAKSKVWHA